MHLQLNASWWQAGLSREAAGSCHVFCIVSRTTPRSARPPKQLHSDRPLDEAKQNAHHAVSERHIALGLPLYAWPIPLAATSNTTITRRCIPSGCPFHTECLKTVRLFLPPTPPQASFKEIITKILHLCLAAVSPVFRALRRQQVPENQRPYEDVNVRRAKSAKLGLRHTLLRYFIRARQRRLMLLYPRLVFSLSV